jgi:pimeloyl-ACP methyl ester carboxylesterase
MRWLLSGLLALIGLAALLAGGAYFALKRADIPYETLAARYESAASRYVDLPGGVRMHYRDEGQTAGPTLLLIHGFSASLHTWEPWAVRLGDRYRILSLDLPGHGLTRAPAGYQASMEAFRDAVAEFARSQGLTRFALAGNSMGGNVAWEYALAHPDQVEGLILVDSSGWPQTSGINSPMLELMRNPTLRPVLRDLDNSNMFRQGLGNSFANPALADDAMITRYSELSRAPGHRDILVQLTLGFGARNHATAERLAPLSMPVLILWGDQDRLIPPEHAQLFHEAIPQSELVMLENVGHIPQEEAADESAAAVDEFLYRVHEGPTLAPTAQ